MLTYARNYVRFTACKTITAKTSRWECLFLDVKIFIIIWWKTELSGYKLSNIFHFKVLVLSCPVDIVL